MKQAFRPHSYEYAAFVKALSGRIRTFRERFLSVLILTVVNVLICNGRVDVWIMAVLGLLAALGLVFELRFAVRLVRKGRAMTKWDVVRYHLRLGLTLTTLISMSPLLWYYGGVEGKLWAACMLCGSLFQVMVTMHASRGASIAGMTPVAIMLIAVPAVDTVSSIGTPTFASKATMFLGAILVVYLAGASLNTLWRNAQSQLETRRRLQAERLKVQKAHDAKSEFLAVTSHELRTPMNAMMGSIELLRRTGLSREQLSLLDMLNEGGDVLLALLNDILDMSKIEARKIEVEAIPVDIRKLLTSLTDLWQARAADRGLDLDLEIAADLPEGVLIDPTRLRQILFNLLSNAVKFTDYGGVSLLATCEAGRDGQPNLVVDVIDTGCGMSPQTLDSLFKPFQQADKSTVRRYGGTGLGLSISRALAEMMGGKLSVTSAVESGSTFRLVLPMIEAELPEDRDGAAFEASANDSERPLRILVAEDHPTNQRILTALLRPSGYEITTVNDGLQAVELFDVEDFDVILMDVHMPEMDGLEATRRIRKMGEIGAHIPIIALTANSTPEDREQCADAGMSDFVGKPIDPRELNTSILNAAQTSLLRRMQEQEPLLLRTAV